MLRILILICLLVELVVGSNGSKRIIKIIFVNLGQALVNTYKVRRVCGDINFKAF